MKPETQLQHLNPERLPVQDGRNINYAENKLSPESGIDLSAESYEHYSEKSAIIADVNQTTILPAPVISDKIVDINTTTGSSPLVANDDDLIEKEWVDKAKKIIADTRDNPHRRDEAVNKLQVDYLKKRYGRELGVAE